VDVFGNFEDLLSAGSRETDIWKVVSRLPTEKIPDALLRLRTARASTGNRSPEADRLHEIECALYFHWAESDPVAALADVSAIPEPADPHAKTTRRNLAESVLAAWMRLDPNEGYRAVKDHEDFGFVGRNLLVQTWTAENVFENLKLFPDKHEDLLGWYCVAAAKDEEERNAVLTALKEQPQMQDRDWGYSMLFREWASNDFNAALAEAENLDHPGLKEHVLDYGLDYHPPAAMRWAVSQNIHPGGRTWSEAYSKWLRTDLKDAQLWLSEQAPAWKNAGHYEALANLQAEQLGLTEKIDMEVARPIWTALMTEWKNRDPQAAAKWLEKDPSGAVRGILKANGSGKSE
jgi:hypothetical protein